jgi:hypothetical protein
LLVSFLIPSRAERVMRIESLSEAENVDLDVVYAWAELEKETEYTPEMKAINAKCVTHFISKVYSVTWKKQSLICNASN